MLCGYAKLRENYRNNDLRDFLQSSGLKTKTNKRGYRFKLVDYLPALSLISRLKKEASPITSQ